MKIILLLSSGMILFGSATPISKIISSSLPVFTASTIRVFLGALTLLPFAWKDLNKIKSFKAHQWWPLLSISIFGVVGFTASLMKGMSYISGVSGSVIMATTPVVTAIGARLFLKSPFTKLKMLATFMTFAGAMSMHLFKSSFHNTAENYLPGIILVFVAVICEAAYTLIGKHATQDTPPLLVTFLATLIALPLFMLLSFTESDSWTLVMNLESTAIGYLCWWGIGTLALGSACWYMGVQNAEASTVPAFMGLMPLSALMMSYWLLRETFHPLHLLGFGLVFGGVLVMSKAHMQMQQQS